MDKAMKQVTNLEGETNYRLLKSAVSQQTLRRLDKNFKSFFICLKDFKKNPGKYKGKPRPPKYKQEKYENLIYNTCAFQVKSRVHIAKEPFCVLFQMPDSKGFKMAQIIFFEQVVVLEKGLEIKVPNQLWNKEIKPVEIIPKPNCFQAVFVYEESPDDFEQVKQNNQVMSIDLGLNNLATCVTNGVIEPFIIDVRLVWPNALIFFSKNKALYKKNHNNKTSSMV